MQYAPGPLNTILDIAGLKVGNASDQHLKSGVTVLSATAPMTTAVHVMGGAPGTRETDLLAPDKSVQQVNALVLSGGSAFGLDAASGVMDGLARDRIGFEVGPAIVPIVPAAILFDLLNGGDKNWVTNPYRALGLAAYEALGEPCEIGNIGAGTGAIAGGLKGGLGSASMVLPSGATVAALVACNALGHATLGDHGHFWAAPFEQNREFGGLGPYPDIPAPETLFHTKLDAMAQGNTTIGIVATDAHLTKSECHRIAIAAHDGFARALMPAHTPMDGDLVFAVSAPDKATDKIGDVLEIGHAAAICMARAIARGVYEARRYDGDTATTWAEKFGAGK